MIIIMLWRLLLLYGFDAAKVAWQSCARLKIQLQTLFLQETFRFYAEGQNALTRLYAATVLKFPRDKTKDSARSHNLRSR
jgi:hypothetical protein